MRSENEVKRVYDEIANFGFGSGYPPDVKLDEKTVVVAKTLKWVLEENNQKNFKDGLEPEYESDDWYEKFLFVLSCIGAFGVFLLLLLPTIKEYWNY